MTTVTKPTNVRAEAQIADNIIATIMPGAAVEVVYKMEKWTQVHITINGYIANSLLVDESTFTWEAWPLPNRDTADINQPFGANPDRYAEFNLPGHEGIDLAAETGEPIAAVADGIIHRIHNLHAGYHNYGNHVRITHMDGFKSIYAHLERISSRLEERQEVKAGDVIGYAGSTGKSTGPHLHITMKREGQGKPGWPYDIIDPTPFMLDLIDKLDLKT